METIDQKRRWGADPIPNAEDAVALTDEIRTALSFQGYGERRAVADVWVRPLRKHRAENGWFTELLRIEGGSVEALPAPEPFRLRQLSVSRAEAGRINAFHIHPRVVQNELWMVLHGQLLVWLVDCRKGSGTEGVRQSLVLSGEEPAQLFIPAGVAHGYRAGADGATLLYGMDQQFDAADPNEGRLPWDFFGPELWEGDRG